ncbi:MAG: hypothetical protein IKU43_06525 [Clostridia bacterium]|nr:hypothetical protein [Clostridia bacterium]
MKELREIKFEELTTRQKLGMVFAPSMHRYNNNWADDDEFLLDLIRNRSLGAIWIQQKVNNFQEQIKRVKEAADYPILILTDAENGVGDFVIGRHNAIGTTGSEKHAYAFGKTVGVNARKWGYNVVCDPVVDMSAGSMRSLGVDKEKVTSLAASIIKGMHDGGVLSIAKHYPGGKHRNEIDSHMAESLSNDTAEELIEYGLYPYLELNKMGLLDGVMTKHQRFINIDDKYPSSLSKTVIDLFRDRGYEGFAITDALCMMGVRAKFGDVESKGLAINAGNDLLLPYTSNNKEQFEMLCEAYDKGYISDEALDKAVKRVLAAQHKVTLLKTDAELTDEEIATFHSINKDGVYTELDEGVSVTIPRDAKNFFVIVAKQETDTLPGGKVDVDTFSTNTWLQPGRIVKKINELFPNSNYQVIHEFPTQNEMMTVLSNSLGCDNLVFMTFSESLAYVGKEYLTHRIVNLINAMQVTNRISTLIHVGNPLVLEELAHVPRVIFGGLSADSIDTTLEVLAGEYTANGKPTYKVNLK